MPATKANRYSICPFGSLSLSRTVSSPTVSIAATERKLSTIGALAREPRAMSRSKLRLTASAVSFVPS
jgi:hypothetical protein